MHYSARFLAIAASLLCGLGAIGCPLPGSVSRRATGPNIILITVESLRVDRIGCYTGGTSTLTPSIDSLAARGIRFERAYTASPSTVPAVASLMTGLYPRRHGLRDDLGGSIREGVPTVASLLKEAGYRTAAVVGTARLDSDRGLDRGFSIYDDSFRTPSRVGPVKAVERPATEVLQVALEFLDQDRADSPFFLWVDFFDPHYDHVSPEGLEEQFPDDPYAAEVASVDAQIGVLLHVLAERGLLERTVIALAGTHGEGLEDHGETGHGIYLYETTIRVPLLIVPAGELVPGDSADVGSEDGQSTSGEHEGRSGRRHGSGSAGVIKDVVGLVDLAPTLLRIANLQLPAEIDGRSLNDLLLPSKPGLDASSGAGRSRRYYIEAVQPHTAYGWAPLFAVVDGDRKIVSGPRLEAFDMSTTRPGGDPLDPLPGWTEDLDRWGRGHFGSPDAAPGDSRDILEQVEAMSLPWSNSPICLQKQDFSDPRDRISLNEPLFRAWILHHQGLRGSAADIMDEVLVEDAANFTALVLSIESATMRGLRDRIDEQIQILQCNYPLRGAPYHLLAHMRINAGELDGAEKMLRLFARLDPWSEAPEYDLAVLSALTGQHERALDHLERAILLGARDFDYIRKDPQLNSLHADPRFEHLVGDGVDRGVPSE